MSRQFSICVLFKENLEAPVPATWMPCQPRFLCGAASMEGQSVWICTAPNFWLVLWIGRIAKFGEMRRLRGKHLAPAAVLDGFASILYWPWLSVTDSLLKVELSRISSGQAQFLLTFEEILPAYPWGVFVSSESNCVQKCHVYRDWPKEITGETASLAGGVNFLLACHGFT